MSKAFTYDQINEHTTESDLWMVIRGNVYDITKFIQDHPGGEEVLLELGGQDATEEYENIGHSESADNMLAKYLIGELDKTSKKPEKEVKMSEQTQPKQASSFGAGPVVIVVLAVSAYLLYTYYLK